MDDITVIDDLTPKRMIVNDLKAMLADKFASGEGIERKAQDLFKFSSTALGIAAALGVSRADIRGNNALVVGYAALLIAYLYHAYCMYRITRPAVYSIVPGIPSKITSWSDFYASYIGGGEDGYLMQTISDLAGTDDTPGAIADAEVINTEKGRFLTLLGYSFMAMVAILVLMAVVAVAG